MSALASLAPARGAAPLEARFAAGLPDDWDRWLEGAGAEASFTQTSHWALFHHLVNGAKPYSIEVTSGGSRVAGALLGHARLRTGTVRAAVKATLAGRGAGWLDCHGGPVVTASDPGPALAALLDETDRLRRHLGVRLVRFATPPSRASWPRQDGIAALFQARGYRAGAWATAIVDLAKPDNSLLAGFRQSARKGIRRCRELRIAVRECRAAAEIEAFVLCYLETRRALGMMEQTAVEVPCVDSASDPAYRFFVAEAPDGAVLGTLATRRFNGTATEINSERTMRARAEKLPVQDLLHWHAFLAHRELGDRWFDLAGFSPDPGDEKERGIRSFKEKWRGETVPLPHYESGAPLLVRALAAVRRRGNGRT